MPNRTAGTDADEAIGTGLRTSASNRLHGHRSPTLVAQVDDATAEGARLNECKPNTLVQPGEEARAATKDDRAHDGGANQNSSAHVLGGRDLDDTLTVFGGAE